MRIILIVLTGILAGCRSGTFPWTMAQAESLVRVVFPDVQQIRPATLQTWLDSPNQEKPLLIDTRSPEEFAVSHLHSAINLTIFAWANEARPLESDGKIVQKVHPYSELWEHLIDAR